MNKQVSQIQGKTQTEPYSLSASGILQRKCDCGQHTIAGGPCDSCSRKADLDGQRIDPETRAYSDPRFGHDLSRVPVRTEPLERPIANFQRRTKVNCDESKHPTERQADAIGAHIGNDMNTVGNVSAGKLQGGVRRIAERHLGVGLADVELRTDQAAQAKAVNAQAQAMTEGNVISFAPGRLSTSTAASRALIGHELTHAAQQRVHRINAPQMQHDCKSSSTPEAQFADQNPGKVFGVEDNLPKAPESNELTLWNFCAGESKLRPDHVKRLKKEAARWKTMLVSGAGPKVSARDDIKIKITGVASSSGNKESNDQIASDRANAVKDFLKGEGLLDKSLLVEGVGSTRPLADETSPENMARNRRVEVSLFVPTAVISSNPLAAVEVDKLTIGKPNRAVPAPKFDVAKNQFVRVNPAMQASANVDITGFQGAAVGFIQFLVTDTRLAQYQSSVDQSTLLLDYGRCNTTLPCRDVADATSRFSFDSRSLTLAKTGSAAGTVSIVDRPGTVFPLRFPNPKSGPFVLNSYFWSMEFDVILGLRDSGTLLPLHSAHWGLAASEDVDVAKKTTSGMGPVAVHGDFRPGAPSTVSSIETAMSGQTCIMMARSREVVPEELPCRPAEIR
jgi:outer membrane protein OmpA-like peptidoglycan-associated protein